MRDGFAPGFIGDVQGFGMSGFFCHPFAGARIASFAQRLKILQSQLRCPPWFPAPRQNFPQIDDRFAASTWQKKRRRGLSSRRQCRSSFLVVSLAFSQPDSRQRRTSSRKAFTSGKLSRSSSACGGIFALPVRSVLNQQLAGRRPGVLDGMPVLMS